MRIVVPALAAALLAGIGASSAAQASVIDFGVKANGGTITFTGTRLNNSSALDLDGSTLTVEDIGPGDNSGLAQDDTITVTPTNIQYGTGILMHDITKSWTGSTGPEAGDVFTEVLDSVVSIDRTTRNAITVELSGVVNDTMGLFKDTPAFMLLAATQVGGPGRAISVSLTNSAVTSVPEPSTWVMMGLGFVGLGYAAVRRGSKGRSAAAMI
jgi:PEP-CTERM motif